MRLASCILAAFLFVASIVSSQAPEAKKEPAAAKKEAKPGPWTGQKVMAKAGILSIQRVAAVDDEGNPTYTTANGFQLDYLVRGEQEEQALIRTREGHEGWVPKENLVLLKDADAFFTKEIESQPEMAVLYQLRAHARRSNNDLKGAIADLTTAIDLEPESAEIRNHRALVWMARKEPDKALSDLEEALKLKPESAIIRCNKATLLAGKKKYAEAVGAFEEALQSEEKCASAHNGLSWLLCTCPDAKVRDGKKALIHAVKAVEMSDRKIGSYVDTLAAAYAEVGRFDDAVKAQQEALQDRDFLLTSGNGAFARLELYRQRKAYRED
jgi:tetratricopeptide (TPR) repeat protein